MKNLLSLFVLGLLVCGLQAESFSQSKEKDSIYTYKRGHTHIFPSITISMDNWILDSPPYAYHNSTIVRNRVFTKRDQKIQIKLNQNIFMMTITNSLPLTLDNRK